MSSGGDDDRSHDHLGINQPNKTIKKKSRRIRDSRTESDAMVVTLPLTQHYVHPRLSHSPPQVATPDETLDLAPR
ncbi:hypothetical protein H5410_015079 [Solanum commersonii]|uniref:Uncharacterized protein n=1 Tax=Solanum commersonii TaxID=4109 RepID=A0A9J5ZTD7_SOLCO|nr:hypothetical protein H5410_015079 [Solanum commersonii]